MSIFTGHLFNKTQMWHYESLMDGEHICHDCGYEIANVDNIGAPTWGMEGHGADKMAAVLLTYACWNKNHTWTYKGNRVFHWNSFLSAFPKWGRLYSIVKRHYKRYSREVIAQLPDHWELTRHEVRVWLAKAERQYRKEKREQRSNASGQATVVGACP